MIATDPYTTGKEAKDAISEAFQSGKPLDGA
jgi:hypothetical protein